MTTCLRVSRNHFSPSSHMICFHTGIQTYSLQHHAFNSNANLIIYEIWYYNCLIIPLRSNSTLHPLLISNWDIFAIIWADSSDLTQIKRKYASHICLFEIKCEYKESKYLFTFFPLLALTYWNLLSMCIFFLLSYFDIKTTTHECTAVWCKSIYYQMQMWYHWFYVISDMLVSHFSNTIGYFVFGFRVVPLLETVHVTSWYPISHKISFHHRWKMCKFPRLLFVVVFSQRIKYPKQK